MPADTVVMQTKVCMWALSWRACCTHDGLSWLAVRQGVEAPACIAQDAEQNDKGYTPTHMGDVDLTSILSMSLPKFVQPLCRPPMLLW